MRVPRSTTAHIPAIGKRLRWFTIFLFLMPLMSCRPVPMDNKSDTTQETHSPRAEPSRAEHERTPCTCVQVTCPGFEPRDPEGRSHPEEGICQMEVSSSLGHYLRHHMYEEAAGKLGRDRISDLTHDLLVCSVERIGDIDRHQAHGLLVGHFPELWL